MNLDAILSWLKSAVEALNRIASNLAGGFSASLYPPGATPLADTSGNGGNTTLNAVLTGVAGMTTYIEGFDIQSSGSTAASVVTATVSDGGTLLLGYTYGSSAGATTMNQRLEIRYPRPIPASLEGADITVSLPALGAGNANAIVNAYGFRA